MKIEQLFSVRGKVALVTGGSRGIGEMIARGYVENGAKVYITARKADACDALARELSRIGECISIPADLSAMDEIERLAGEMQRREKRLDILVNNAGATWGASFEDFPESGWDKIMDLNVKSVFFLTQRLLKLLEAAGRADDFARVINVGSIDGMHVSGIETYSYAASKAGVLHVTRMMAKYLAKKHIAVNAIAPGYFPSKMTAAIPEEIGQVVVRQTRCCGSAVRRIWPGRRSIFRRRPAGSCAGPRSRSTAVTRPRRERRVVLPPLNFSREKRRDQRTGPKRPPGAERLRQTIGNDPERRSVEAEPEMRGADLDVLAVHSLRLQTGLPGDDTVGSRIDGGGRHRYGSREGSHPFRPRRCGLLAGKQAPQGTDIARGRRGKRASERDDHADVRRDLARHFARHDSAAAPAHQADRQTGCGPQARRLLGDRRQIRVRSPDVAPAVPAVHVVAQTGQEPADCDGRAIVGAQSRKNDHPLALAPRRGRQEGSRGQQRRNVQQTARLERQQTGRRRLDLVFGTHRPCLSPADRRFAATTPLARHAFVFFLVELLLVEFADRRFRQVGADLHGLQHLVLAELVLEKDLELVERERGRITLQFDEGLGRLPPIRILHADDADLFDGRMLEDGFLDHARIDVVAAAQQHVLGAVDDINITVFIHVADVAGTQEPVGGHYLGRRLRILPIAFHHVRTLDADLATLSQPHVFPVAGDAGELDDDSRDGNAARAGPWRPLRRREGAGRRRLGHAPALREPAAREFLKSPLDLERQGRAAGGAPFDRR